jgi:hypothetical protein
LKRFNYLKNNYNLGITKSNFLKAELWCILNRKHVKKMIQKDYKEKYINSFDEMWVPDEHYFINFINQEFNNEIYNYKSTYTLWTQEDIKHPYSFGPILNNREKNIIKKASEESFFMRKFKYGDKSNVYEFILNLISK